MIGKIEILPDVGLARDHQGLRDAYRMATKSPDPSNQNGAVLIRPAEDGFVDCVTGWNDFPPGIVPMPGQMLERDWKIANIEHAERAAIFKAARRHMATSGATLYCPWVACTDCARAIVLAGIVRVVCHRERMGLTPERWQASVAAGLAILAAGDVALDYVDGPIRGAPTIRANGGLFSPAGDVVL